jgi:hypothetical protein
VRRAGDGGFEAGVPLRVRRTGGARWSLRRRKPDQDASARTAAQTG